MNQQKRWVAVGRAIRARMDELHLTKAELSRQAGVSDTSINAYLEGQPIVRADKRRGLLEALRWTPDSLDRMLAGHKPIALPDQTVYSFSADEVNQVFDRLHTIEEKVQRFEMLFEEIMRTLDGLVGDGPGSAPRRR